MKRLSAFALPLALFFCVIPLATLQSVHAFDWEKLNNKLEKLKKNKHPHPFHENHTISLRTICRADDYQRL